MNINKIIFIYIIVLPLSLFSQQFTEKVFQQLYTVSYFESISFFGNGNKIIYTVSSPNFEKNKYTNTLWMKDLTSGSPASKINLKDGSYSSLTASNDGKNIYFLSNVNGNGNQVYFYSLNDGTLQQITNSPKSIQKYIFSNTFDKLYYLAEDTLSSGEKNVLEKKQDGYFWEENKKFNSIYELNLTTKKTTKLTFGYNIKSFTLSHNGKYIGVLGTTDANISTENTTEVYLYDVQGKTTKRLTRNNIIERQLSWSENDDYLLFISAANENLEPYYQETIFKLNLNGEKPINLLPTFQYQVIKYDIEPTSKSIIFIANKGLTQQLFKLNINDGTVNELTDYKGVVKNFLINNVSSKIVLQISDPYTPDVLAIGQIGKWDFKILQKFATSWLDLNPNINKSLLPKYQPIEWFSTDGTKIQGIVILPANFDRTKPYPLIVELHGGPNGSYQLIYSQHWSTLPQLLTSNGYIILQVNYRGSAGYGNSFMRGIINNFFELGTEDILSGVNFLIETGIADKNKLALIGYSAGAHFTNWIITQTNIFKAAISIAGMSNWISFYAQTEVPYLREIWFNSTPYDNYEKWFSQSPIKYAKNITTPTLFVGGELDKRVPLTQSLEMWKALNRLNIPTHLLVFPRESHSIEELSHQYQLIKNEIEWINKFLRE
ncbi:prolyl oligopeptidase family serine peptidase [Melioribacteraceae bacterium 4301-Me]|uniref:alpha/beta hydrolase family protein n=1 Tax=Pyranulibacter aquaticus TaxID=3163344 RepID=UPI003596C61C